MGERMPSSMSIGQKDQLNDDVKGSEEATGERTLRSRSVGRQDAHLKDDHSPFKLKACMEQWARGRPAQGPFGQKDAQLNDNLRPLA